MQMLGHGNIRSMLIYTQLGSVESDESHSTTAKNIEETKNL